MSVARGGRLASRGVSRLAKGPEKKKPIEVCPDLKDDEDTCPREFPEGGGKLLIPGKRSAEGASALGWRRGDPSRTWGGGNSEEKSEEGGDTIDALDHPKEVGKPVRYVLKARNKPKGTSAKGVHVKKKRKVGTLY